MAINVGSMSASYSLDTKGFTTGVQTVGKGFSTMQRGLLAGRRGLQLFE